MALQLKGTELESGHKGKYGLGAKEEEEEHESLARSLWLRFGHNCFADIRQFDG